MIAEIVPVTDVLMTAVVNTVFWGTLVGFGRRPCDQMLRVTRGS